MSVMLCHCMLCVARLMCLFVLCVACLTMFGNCLVKQFAMCLGLVAILLLNVMDVFSVCDVALLDRPCMCICVLCLADTCTSEVHPVFNPVAPYGYLLSDMYLFMADITNPDTFV